MQPNLNPEIYIPFPHLLDQRLLAAPLTIFVLSIFCGNKAFSCECSCLANDATQLS